MAKKKKIHWHLSKKYNYIPTNPTQFELNRIRLCSQFSRVRIPPPPSWVINFSNLFSMKSQCVNGSNRKISPTESKIRNAPGPFIAILFYSMGNNLVQSRFSRIYITIPCYHSRNLRSCFMRISQIH